MKDIVIVIEGSDSDNNIHKGWYMTSCERFTFDKFDSAMQRAKKAFGVNKAWPILIYELDEE